MGGHVFPRVADHGAPARLRRLHADPEEAERAFGEDGAAISIMLTASSTPTS